MFFLQSLMIILMLILKTSFLLSKTQNYVSAGTLSAKYNKNLSKVFRKGFELLVYWSKYRTKSEIKHMRNKCRYVP